MQGWIKLALKLLEIGWALYGNHKQKSHDKAVKRIKDDPSGAWAARFGRVQSDTGETMPTTPTSESSSDRAK